MKWESLLFLTVKLAVASVIGTLVLLALADDPWDGDELFKGPIVGITSYSGGNLKELFATLRGLGN